MKSQRNLRYAALKKFFSTFLLSIIIFGGSFSMVTMPAFADDDIIIDPKGTVSPPATGGSSTTSTTEEEKKETTDDRSKFGTSAERITADAALGDEIALLPGPNINFNQLLNIVITWSAQLAASVAIFIFVFRSFAAIQGTEESRNNLKSTIIKILIGLTLVFFSYQIISFVMGIIWATT